MLALNYKKPEKNGSFNHTNPFVNVKLQREAAHGGEAIKYNLFVISRKKMQTFDFPTCMPFYQEGTM